MENAAAFAVLVSGFVTSFGLAFVVERLVLTQILRTLAVRAAVPPRAATAGKSRR